MNIGKICFSNLMVFFSSLVNWKIGALSPAVDSSFASMEGTDNNLFSYYNYSPSPSSPNSFPSFGETISPTGTSGSSPLHPNPTPSPPITSSPLELISETSPMTPNQFLSSETLDFPISASNFDLHDSISEEAEEAVIDVNSSRKKLKKKETKRERESLSISPPPSPSPRASSASPIEAPALSRSTATRGRVVSPSRKVIAPPSKAPPPVNMPIKSSAPPVPFRGSNVSLPPSGPSKSHSVYKPLRGEESRLQSKELKEGDKQVF